MKLFFTLFFLLFITASAQAQAPFFQGKTITIIVGTKAGDAYDLYPRMLAEFMPKYIPGSPNIIIQNVPGAASMIAANQVYNVAKPDGLTLGAIYPALYFEQLTKKPEVKFDWTKFTWIGNPVTSNHLLYMRSDAPYKSMDEIRNASDGAEVRFQRHHLNGLLLAQTHGGHPGNQIRYRIGLSVRSGCRSCRGARRGGLPSLYDHRLFCARAFYLLAKETFRQRAHAERREARLAAKGSTHDLRTDG